MTSDTTTERDVTLDVVAALDMYEGTMGSESTTIESVEESTASRFSVVVTLSNGDKYELRVREVRPWREIRRRLMARKILTITVRELQPGDMFIDKGREVYTIKEVIRDEPDERILRVQWHDGGFDIRSWNAEDFDHPMEILREDDE